MDIQCAECEHVCELRVKEQGALSGGFSNNHEISIDFTFSDAAQADLVQVELRFARGYEVLAENDSFRVLAKNKMELLRLFGIMKALKWEILTSTAIQIVENVETSSNTFVVSTMYYSRPVRTEPVLLLHPQEGSSNTNIVNSDSVREPDATVLEDNGAAADNTKASTTVSSPDQAKAKPRKSISQRFVSMLTPSFVSGKQSSTASSNPDAPVASNAAPNGDAAGLQDQENPNPADNAINVEERAVSTDSNLGFTVTDISNSADSSSRDQTEQGQGGTEELQLNVDPTATADTATTPAESTSSSAADPQVEGPPAAHTPTPQPPPTDNTTPQSGGTPNRKPRKSLSQRFGNLLSPSKQSQLETEAAAIPPAEPERHDNPILQRFKSKSEDSNDNSKRNEVESDEENEASAVAKSSPSVEPRSRQLLRRLSAAKMTAQPAAISSQETEPDSVT